MGYHVRSRVPNMTFCVPALGSIFNCCTTIGKTVSVGPPPITLIKECPAGNSGKYLSDAKSWLLIEVTRNSQCIDLHLENSANLKSALRIPSRMKLGIPSFVADRKNPASTFIHHFFTVSIRKMSVNQIYQDRSPLYDKIVPPQSFELSS